MKFKLILLFIFLFCFPLSLLAEKISFNDEEKNTIKNLGSIKVGVMNDMPPLEYYGAGYKHQGIISDFLIEAIKKLGIKVEYEASTYEKIYNQALKNEIDMLSYSVKSIKNKNIFLFTDPYLEIDNAIYTKRNNSAINHIQDISNNLVAVKYDDYYLATTLKDKYPDMSLRFANSTEEALQMLITGEIESFVGNIMTTNYLINKLNLDNEIKKIDLPWLKTPIRFAISKDKPKLYKLLQKAIKSIDYETYNNITNKWLRGKNKYKKLPIFLTQKENEWIKNHPDILVGASSEWRPFSYYENGKLQGVTSGYLDIISQKTGITFSYKEFKSFSNMLKAMKDKKINIVDAVVASKKRKEYMLFSHTYLSLNNIVATRKNSEKITNINELSNKKVGTIKGYIVSSYIKNDIPNAKNIEFDDIKNGLRALSTGKLDAFVLDLPMFDYYTAKYKMTNLIISCDTPYSFPIHFGIKKDDKILLDIINKALKAINEKEQNEIYRKWISVKFAQKVDYELIWKIIGFFLLFLIIALIWNRSLSKEIQKRKRIEKELIKAKEIAENATKAKSIFLANMSHEIRTPMNSVIGFAQLLDELVKDPVQKGYLRSIKVGGNALLGIINDILDLSKIEAGQLKITKESVHIYNLFLEMEQLFHDKIAQKNLNFEINIKPDIPKFLILDGVRLRQVLLNLIGNAIKFTENGKITLKVERVFKDENKSKLDLKFDVIDTGIGIPKKEQESVFGDFVQRKKQSVKKYGGTGLGLSICKRLIDAMDGEITLKSQEGKGTAFSVLLKDIGVSTLKEEKIDEIKGKIEFLKSNILIVDDIDENRELVKAIFHNCALHVIEAKNGKEAIDIVNKNKIDLVLMDLQMPIMDGYEATKIIRQNHKELPIVALTASVMGEDLEKVPKYGFSDYLRKPASKNDIINKLVHFLPYKNQAENAKIDDNKIVFKTSEIKEIFVQKMGIDLLDEWNEVKDKGDMQLIENFNKKIIDLLKIQSIPILEKYTNDICVCIDGFDLVEMFNLMGIYPNLVKQIKNAEVKNV